MLTCNISPVFRNIQFQCFSRRLVGSLAIDTVCTHNTSKHNSDQCDVLSVFLLLHSIVMFNENHWCENKLPSKSTNSSTLSTINHCYWKSTVENVLFTAMFGLHMKSSPHCRLSSIDVFLQQRCDLNSVGNKRQCKNSTSNRNALS